MSATLNPSEYKNGFLNYLEENRSHNTKKNYTYPVEEFCEFMEDNKHVFHLEEDKVFENADMIREYYNKTNVHNVKISAIRSFLDYMGKQVSSRDQMVLEQVSELVSSDKIETDTQSRLSKNELEKMLLDEEEIERMLEDAEYTEKLILRLLLDTGCRAGEIAAFRPDDVDFNPSESVSCKISIDKTYVQGDGVQETPKTSNSNRVVTLKVKTKQMLKDYIEFNNIEDDEPVIGYYNKVYDAVKDSGVRAGVRTYTNDNGDLCTHVSPHWFRHIVCTRLVVRDNGLGDNDIIRYTGHGSVSALEVYKHFDHSDVVRVHTK